MAHFTHKPTYAYLPFLRSFRLGWRIPNLITQDQKTGPLFANLCVLSMGMSTSQCAASETKTIILIDSTPRTTVLVFCNTLCDWVSCNIHNFVFCHIYVVFVSVSCNAHRQHTEISNLKRFEQIELPAKLLNNFVWSNKSNINPWWTRQWVKISLSHGHARRRVRLSLTSSALLIFLVKSFFLA